MKNDKTSKIVEVNYKPKTYQIAVTDNKKTYWIHPAVTSMKWGGSRREVSRTLNFECLKFNNRITNFAEGNVVIIYDETGKKELMRYYITKKTISGSGDTISYTARDIRWWLIRNQQDNKFENKTATDIMKELCKTNGVPMGELENTGHKFTCLQFVKMSPWDMMITALTETKKNTGKQYIIKIKSGKLILLEKKKASVIWRIEEGNSLLDSSYDESIEEIYTQVKVVGKDKKGKYISGEAKDKEKQKKYGLMQEFVEQTGETTESKLKNIAKHRLKELAVLKKGGSITTFGIDGLEAGDVIYVNDSQTGLSGNFYIESDSHTYTNYNHTMSLNLSWTDDIPALNYKAPKK